MIRVSKVYVLKTASTLVFNENGIFVKLYDLSQMFLKQNFLSSQVMTGF